MADAILSRGSTSVTLPILPLEGGLAVARDTGNPNLGTPAVGREDPRVSDHLSAGDQFVVIGLLHGTNAYSDAQTLAESLIKPRATTGTPLQLDLSSLPSHGTYDVGPTTNAAATLAYKQGLRDVVVVQLALQVVDETIGGSQDAQGTTSPDSGSGVKLTDGSNPVTLSSDLQVTRSVGRPNAKLQARTTELPALIDGNKPARDVFKITASNLSEADAVTLSETLVRNRLGQGSLTLHFQGNEWGLDAYPVAPVQSQSVRYTFQTGRTGFVNVPTLKLRVVDTR